MDNKGDNHARGDDLPEESKDVSREPKDDYGLRRRTKGRPSEDEHKEEYDKDEHKAECDKDEHKEEWDKDEHKEECDKDELKEECDKDERKEECDEELPTLPLLPTNN
ncbi:hypothetical protein GE061_002757 [Apolygus lucorum]|uniref:Uncharacterized protein n=1 Tax=Apolygus lucorum TaxID=248454 RepID=A0A8S9X8M8_APOLU|nr:hypothetical protein GE061_002757 [Apolygus lucorum]